ncbi:MAG: hypothetical protein V1742_11365 [Pseudomonadota bacterium]
MPVWVRGLAIILVVLSLFVTPLSSSASDENVYIDAIGALSGSYLYMAYAYIGVTADAYSKNIYPASQVKLMMEEKVNFLDKLMQRLQQVQATNLAPKDKQFVESMIEIFGLLKTEAQSLAAFAATNSPTDVEKYDLARKQAWPKIKILLGIK